MVTFAHENAFAKSEGTLCELGFFNLKQRSEHVACANAQVPVLLLPLAPNVL